MHGQLSIPLVLWPAPAATADPITSHEAAAAVDASGIRAAQARHVLALVRASPGLTCGEYAARAHVLDRVQVARRLSDLKRAGVLRQGEPRASAGGSPRREVTWWLR